MGKGISFAAIAIGIAATAIFAPPAIVSEVTLLFIIVCVAVLLS